MDNTIVKPKPLPLAPLVFVILGGVAGMFAIIQLAFFPTLVSIGCFVLAYKTTIQ